MTRPTLEVPIDSIESARLAAVHADRLEVCSDLATEGWTPELPLLEAVVGLARPTGTGVVALIRPRTAASGSSCASFVLSPEGLQASLEMIDACASIGVHGVAIGPLLPEGRIDRESSGVLGERARVHGLEVSFLRSYDLVPEAEDALESLRAVGVLRVLTTGASCWDAASVPISKRLDRLAADVATAGRLASGTTDRRHALRKPES